MHSIEKRSSGFFVRSLRAKISCVVSSADPTEVGDVLISTEIWSVYKGNLKEILDLEVIFDQILTIIVDDWPL